MVVDLGDGGDARCGVLEGVSDILRVRAAALHPQQPDHRCETVLDAVAHLARQHGLVIESFLKVGVGMLTLDGDTEEAGEAGEEVGVRDVELTWFWAVDLQDAERKVLFTASRDKDIDRASDPVIRQELRRSKPRLLLKVVRDHHLPGLKSVARRRFEVETQRHPTDGTRSPADARADQQTLIVRNVFQYLRKAGVKSLGAEFGGALQDFSDVTGLQREATELAQ